MNKHVCYRQTDKEYPVVVRGEGVYLYDTEGKKYIDAVSGASVVNIGHAVPEIIDAMTKQAKKLCYTHPMVWDHWPQQELAETVVNMAPAGLSRVYFASGGSEANECALKFAYQYHAERGHLSKYKVISRWQSYHGYTIAALSMSGRTQWRSLFTPYLLEFPHIHPPFCYRCPYGHTYPDCKIHCAEELETVIQCEGPDTISAFISEPILGTSATAVVPPPGYYERIREICNKYDVLMICDEVITGFGRTGKNFGIQHWNIVPDIITTGKGTSAGYTPLSSIIIHDKIYNVVAEGSKSFGQGFTYASNPLSCAIVIEVLKYITDHNLVEAARLKGEYFLKALDRIASIPIVGAVRGKGLLIGLEFVKNKEKRTPFPEEMNVAARISAAALKRGVYIFSGFRGVSDEFSIGDHIKIYPPFTVSETQIDEIVAGLYESIVEVQESL